MNAGLGDVTFIKHTTLKENNANPDLYVYLSKDGRREGVYCIANFFIVPKTPKTSSLGVVNKHGPTLLVGPIVSKSMQFVDIWESKGVCITTEWVLTLYWGYCAGVASRTLA